MTELGKLEKVDLRKVWEHEARDFSTWLAMPENLEMLGKEIGIEIEHLGTEVEMGRFRIDVLAKEPNTDERIIIENQLESTDHDHLGKVITYAAGLDARYLIWIVKEVLDEHLKAVEWLNEHLDETVRCFLIKIEVWQIGDSKPAPKFDIVSVKNDWVANIKKTTPSGEVSSLGIKQLAFWEKFAEYVRAQDPRIKLHTPRPQHYMDFSIGNSISHIALTLNSQKKKFSVYLYIPNDKMLYQYLKDNEEQINMQLGTPIIWFEANVASGGGIDFHVDDIFDESRQAEYFGWLYASLKTQKATLVPYIEEYRNQGL